MIAGFFPATTMPDADWWQLLWPDPMKVLIEMGVPPASVVVDLCCFCYRHRPRDARSRAGGRRCDWRDQLPFCLGGRHGLACGCAGAGRLRFPCEHLPRCPGSAGLGESRRRDPQGQRAIRGRQLASSSPRGNHGSRAVARAKNGDAGRSPRCGDDRQTRRVLAEPHGRIAAVPLWGSLRQGLAQSPCDTTGARLS
jgi:hypothetical protein